MEEVYGYMEKLTDYRIEILVMTVELLLWKICLFSQIPNIDILMSKLLMKFQA